MASDYGDEAGGKLLDWMLRIGQEAGAEAMARSARELSERLAGIRGTIAGGRAEQVAAEGAPTYAKLSLEELSGLPEYATSSPARPATGCSSRWRTHPRSTRHSASWSKRRARPQTAPGSGSPR